MKVTYRIILKVDTTDYVETLGKIDDLIQNKLDGNPDITSISIIKPRSNRS